MKKIILALCMIVLSTVAFGQSRVYGAIIASARVTTGKMTVTVTFEENQDKYASYLKNEKGEDLQFSSLINAMNHLSKFGWELEDTYTSTLGDKLVELQNFYWIISKPVDVTDDSKTE